MIVGSRRWREIGFRIGTGHRLGGCQESSRIALLIKVTQPRSGGRIAFGELGSSRRLLVLLNGLWVSIGPCLGRGCRLDRRCGSRLMTLGTEVSLPWDAGWVCASRLGSSSHLRGNRVQMGQFLGNRRGTWWDALGDKVALPWHVRRWVHRVESVLAPEGFSRLPGQMRQGKVCQIKRSGSGIDPIAVHCVQIWINSSWVYWLLWFPSSLNGSKIKVTINTL